MVTFFQLKKDYTQTALQNKERNARLRNKTFGEGGGNDGGPVARLCSLLGSREDRKNLKEEPKKDRNKG